MTQHLTKKQSLWQSRLAAAEQSGVALADFAKQHALPIKQLYAWRSRLKQLNAQPLDADRPFVRVTSKTEPAPHVRVTLPNGVSLTFNTFDLDTLQMLRAL